MRTSAREKLVPRKYGPSGAAYLPHRSINHTLLTKDGTPGYLAEEQIKGANITPRAMCGIQKSACGQALFRGKSVLVQEGVEHGEAVVQLGRLFSPLLITVRLQGMKLAQ